MITCNTNELSHNLPDRIDYLLVCASYEERCLTLYNYVESSCVEKTAVFYFKQFYENVISNAELLATKFNANKYEFDNSKPTSIADKIIEFFGENVVENVSKKPNVVIDASTFTRESLLIILKYLQINKDKFSDIIFLYRSAEVSHNLSDAVLNIRSVIGYMGDIQPEKPTHLIVISGYEYERAKEIIDTIEPDYISIIYGGIGESINDDIQKNNKIFTDKLVAYYSFEIVNKFSHTLIDIDSLKNKLDETIVSRKDCNVVIAPLNNKLSTIAAGLAASANPHVQVCYSQMANYNMSNYSHALDLCYIENLDLS